MLGIPESPPEEWPKHPIVATALAVGAVGRLRPAGVAKLQLRWVRAVITAAATSPPYAGLWRPEQVTAALAAPTAASAVACLPILPNERLRGTPPDARFTRVPSPGTVVHRSSGSTGGRLHVHYPPGGGWWLGVLNARWAVQRRTRPWSRAVSLGDSPATRTPGVLGRVVNGMRRSAGPVSARDHAHYVLRVRPAAVSGPGKTLVAVGRELHALGWRPDRWPGLVITFGEVLDETTRGLIAELWGRRPTDTYGTTETGPAALQCSALDLYHVVETTTVLEILDENGSPSSPGEVGDVVVTNIWNTLHPVVRYRIDDRAALSGRPCRCGYDGPALVSVDGRLWDWLWDGAGGRVPPQRLFLAHLMDFDLLPRVRFCRVHQAADGAILIEIQGDVPPSALEECRQRASAVFADRLAVTVRRVGDDFTIPAHRWRSVSSDYWAAH